MFNERPELPVAVGLTGGAWRVGLEAMSSPLTAKGPQPPACVTTIALRLTQVT